MKRGFTLVEQMVALAMIGIGGLAFDSLAQYSERAALAELQRARAGILLQYHAAQSVSGLPKQPEVLGRLSASLPEVKVERVVKGDLVTLTATWRAAEGPPGRRVLTVLGARP